MGMQACRTCGVEFERKGRGPHRYCEAHRPDRREAQIRYQRELRKREKAARPISHCEVCAAEMPGRRADARWCRKCRPQRRSVPRQASAVASCVECGAQFTAWRSDALRCPACRLLDPKARSRRYEASRSHKCLDCDAAVGRKSKRCRTCSDKDPGRIRRGEANHLWKGGRTRANGYVYVRIHPPGYKGHPYRAEHIVVWERVNAKPLPKGWVVHHLNGVKDDNRPENLLGTPQHRHHQHPREALRPYERRIKNLEDQLAALQRLKLFEPA